MSEEIKKENPVGDAPEEAPAADTALNEELENLRDTFQEKLDETVEEAAAGPVIQELETHSAEAEEEAEEEELPEISASELKDAYETMKDFANLYDYDNMVFILDSLKGYRLSAADREKLRNIRTWTESFQWEEIARALG